MNITSYKVFAYDRDRLSKTRKVKLILGFEVEITCPHCTTKHNFATSGVLLDSAPLTKFSKKLEIPIEVRSEARSLETQFECTQCGILFSPIPKKSREKFLEDVCSLVTNDWISAEIERLYSEKQQDSP